MKNNPNKKNQFAYALCVAGVLALGANAATAGEENGKGEPIPGGEKGRSLCSYSGLQDDPIEDAGIFKGDRVQSWGQLPKFVRDILKSMGGHPGIACNPKKIGG